MSWNLILQSLHPTGRRPSRCLMGRVAGLAQPAQVLLVSWDTSTDRLVSSLLQWLEAHLGGGFSEGCGGPVGQGSWEGGLHCQAFQEPSCRHVLVHFKGSGVRLAPESVELSRRWVTQSGVDSEVVVVLPWGEGGGDLPPRLRHYNWLRHPAPASEISLSILQAAGVGARRTLFLSYRRQDSEALADQIFEALAREGFRVFLDRFSWMPGRLFPEEIAEELADKGVVLLLETTDLHLSRWTQWELAFARAYHLGTLALNVDGAPQQRGIARKDRHDVTVGSDGELASTDLEQAIRFILRRYNLAELRRRIFLEALVRRAAVAAGGQVEVRGDGLFDVRSGGHGALVLPSGRPGNLEDLGRLGRAFPGPAAGGSHRVLAGQHQHLRAGTRRDLDWLAKRAQVSLCSPLGLYRSIQKVLHGGTP